MQGWDMAVWDGVDDVWDGVPAEAAQGNAANQSVGQLEREGNTRLIRQE